MVDPQTSRFWRAALQSGLIDTVALQSCWDKLPEEKRTIDAIDRRLARQAVNAGYLTMWQAQQLMTGRASGFKIDRYVLQDLIGQGGMGRVYLAKDSRLSRQVAIKVLSTTRMNNPRAIARFQREAKVGAQLQHENLVRIYDEGESGNIRYLVMEFIEGKNIAHLIAEQGPLAWAPAVRLIRQIALGLEHAQIKGLIHRDVNPSNILVTHDGIAKLTDLGLAIDLADEANVTRDGATVGTFDYISPEQAKHSREVDTRSDIYSLGCTFYHVLSGRVPFPVPSLAEKLYAHQLHQAEPLHTLVPDIPEGLSRIVSKMMAKKPEDRYSTPLAVAQALEPYSDESARLNPASLVSHNTHEDRVDSGQRTKVVAIPRTEPQPVSPEPTTPDSIPEPEQIPSNTFVSDPALSIFSVDTGPEEPLSSSRTPIGRAKGKTKTPVEKAEAGLQKSGIKKSIFIGLGIAALAIVVVVIAAGLNKNRQKAGNGASGGPAVTVKTTPASKTKSNESPTPKTTKQPSISVISRDGQQAFDNLTDALNSAMGNGGDVVLNPTSVLRLTSGTQQPIRIMRNITIRAADGTNPLIALEVGGTNPWLLVTSKGSLTLKGIRIIAHYQPLSGSTTLIQSGGNLRIEDCSMVANGSAGQSSAVFFEGLRLDVVGTLISDFYRAIRVESVPGSQVSISQSMLVRSGQNVGLPGWALKMDLLSTNNRANLPPRRVSIAHSTIKGMGLLDLKDFSAANPLVVEVDHIALQVKAILSWEARKGDLGAAWVQGLKWKGTGNRYDITAAAWVFTKADGELPLEKSPTDGPTWAEAVGSDKDAKLQSFQFARDPNKRMPDESVEAEHFALVGDDLKNVGADPKKVGPRTATEDEPAKIKATELKDLENKPATASEPESGKSKVEQKVSKPTEEKAAAK
jgi:serine/threonine protein kinase